MSDAPADLPSFAALAWQLLSRATVDRRSPARVPTLATVDAEGHPQARTVVLRKVEPSAHRVWIHTDRRSSKVSDLTGTNRAALCIWHHKADLQIRLQVIASLLSGEEVLPLWKDIPEPARRVYGGSPSPGSLLASPEDHVAHPDPADLLVIRCDITAMDLLHLGVDRHRRAVYSAADDWRGHWVAP